LSKWFPATESFDFVSDPPEVYLCRRVVDLGEESYQIVCSRVDLPLAKGMILGVLGGIDLVVWVLVTMVVFKLTA